MSGGSPSRPAKLVRYARFIYIRELGLGAEVKRGQHRRKQSLDLLVLDRYMLIDRLTPICSVSKQGRRATLPFRAESGRHIHQITRSCLEQLPKAGKRAAGDRDFDTHALPRRDADAVTPRHRGGVNLSFLLP